MKKKLTSQSIRIKYIYVYRDDLEEIYNLLHRYSNEVGFEVDEYPLDSPDELEQIREKELQKVGLSIHEPRVSIDFDEYGAKIYSQDSDDINSAAIINKLTSILNGRKRKLVDYIDNRTYKFALSAWIIGAICLISNKLYYPYILYLGISLCTLGLVLFGMYLYVNVTKQTASKVFLSLKKDRPSFLERNRDEIVVGIIMLILGAIVGKFF